MKSHTIPAAVVRSSILTEFKRLAIAHKLDPIDLMKRVGVDRRFLEDPDLPVPMQAVAELFEIAALALGIDDFGLRLAETRGLPDLGPVTLMLREQPTMGDALRTLIAFFHLHTNAIYMHLEPGEEPMVTVDIFTGQSGSCRQVIDTSVASLTGIVRWLLGDDWAPAVACFTHARPVSRVRFDRFFRCPIDFQHEFNGIVLRSSDLDKPLPASSPAMRRQVERYIRSIDVASSDTYVHRVTQIITMALPRGEARAQLVARFLGTDCRTLHRRLARAGLNYSTLLEKVRENMASQHLTGSDQPLSNIAGLLGFASLSAFSTWFTRAHRCAPSVWRKAQRAR